MSVPSGRPRAVPKVGDPVPRRSEGLSVRGADLSIGRAAWLHALVKSGAVDHWGRLTKDVWDPFERVVIRAELPEAAKEGA